MSDPIIQLKLNEDSKSPGYLKGYNDCQRFHRELTSSSIVRTAGYEPPSGEEDQYAAGWKQVTLDRQQAEESTQNGAIIGIVSAIGVLPS
jgi:hypothetical protein